MELTIRLSPKLDKRLTALSKKTCRSKGHIAIEAIKYYIEDLDDNYSGFAILENMGKLYTFEEVEKICGLKD